MENAEARSNRRLAGCWKPSEDPSSVSHLLSHRKSWPENQVLCPAPTALVHVFTKLGNTTTFFFFWVFYSSPLPFIYFACSFLLSNHLSLTNPHQNNWRTSWIVFMPTDSGPLPMFLELPCTSECLITKKKKKITTFINWQTHNVFNLFKRKHPVNYCSSPSLAKDQPTNASGDRGSALAKPYCHSNQKWTVMEETVFYSSSKLVRTSGKAIFPLQEVFT